MRNLIFLLFALAAPLSAQETLIFQWEPISHPQFREYAWALHSDGQPIDAGRTQQTSITVTVPSTVYASYHVTVSWVHRQNGKLTWHTSTPTQSITEPVIEPPDTIVEPPDTTVAPDSIRIAYLRFDVPATLANLHWGSYSGLAPGDSIKACGYSFQEGQLISISDPMCPQLPPEIPSGPTDPPEWLTVDFGQVNGEWYTWTNGGPVTSVVNGELTVDLTADTEGYAGMSVAGVDLRNKEVIAYFRGTPSRTGTEAWLVIQDPVTDRRYYAGRAGSRTVAVVDDQGYTILDSGGWRADWDIAIRHEGNELLFQTVSQIDGRAGTRYRIPVDIDLSNVTISLMAGTQIPIRATDVGTARWSGLVVRPIQ